MAVQSNYHSTWIINSCKALKLKNLVSGSTQGIVVSLFGSGLILEGGLSGEKHPINYDICQNEIENSTISNRKVRDFGFVKTTKTTNNLLINSQSKNL
jgi:hypothetical protein